MRRWGPWLDPSSDVYANPGEPLWYVNREHGEEYLDGERAGALSRVFVPARVTDNPHLLGADPTYVERLRGLDPLQMQIDDAVPFRVQRRRRRLRMTALHRRPQPLGVEARKLVEHRAHDHVDGAEPASLPPHRQTLNPM